MVTLYLDGAQRDEGGKEIPTGHPPTDGKPQSFLSVMQVAKQGSIKTLETMDERGIF